jgi:hypothetical protein
VAVLVLVSSDPEASHRANEAIRIALGLAVAESDLILLLWGPAAKVLGADVEDHVDGEDTHKHLATLERLGQAVHVEAAALHSHPFLTRTALRLVPVTEDQLPSLI